MVRNPRGDKGLVNLDSTCGVMTITDSTWRQGIIVWLCDDGVASNQHRSAAHPVAGRVPSSDDSVQRSAWRRELIDAARDVRVFDQGRSVMRLDACVDDQ